MRNSSGRNSKQLKTIDWRSSGKWFFLSSLVGVAAGLAAILLHFLTEVVQSFALTSLSGYQPPHPAGPGDFAFGPATEVIPWMIILVMVAGGMISGILVSWLAPEAAGAGTDATIDAFHNNRGNMRRRVPFVKLICSSITLGTGGSAGREGPIAQIGAALGSLLANRFDLSARDRRIMLAAGMGAGVGAIFRAPLAGALFAAEILYREANLESDVIVPAAISSIIGYSIFSFSLPTESRFVPLFGGAFEGAVSTPFELISYALLALIISVLGILHVRCFHATQSAFDRFPVYHWAKPALGAGLAGTLTVMVYLSLSSYIGNSEFVLSALSTGYGAVTTSMSSPQTIGIWLLVLVALLKVLTTSLTVASGGSGGVFGPSIVIGGCLGAAVGRYFQMVFPDGWVQQPEAFALVGMAGFFAGCAHAPISTILMVSELTGNYKLLLPTMWVSTLCFLLMRPWTLYRKQVPTPLESPSHKGDFIVDVLEDIKVEEVYQKERLLMLIPEAMPLEDIVHTIADTHQHYFPVVDENEVMVGIFSSDDVRAYLFDETIWKLADASDLMITEIVSVAPDDNLSSVLKKFTSRNLDELPVISADQPGKLLGMLRRKETIGFYNRRLMELKQQAAEQNE